MHKTEDFLHKSEKYAKWEKTGPPDKCQNAYPFNQKA